MRTTAIKTEGLKTNPAINTVLADTGATAFDAGNYAVSVHISASVASRVALEFWSADETVELIRSHRYSLAAGISPPPEFVRNFPFTRPFRIYLKLAVALTGDIQGTIVVEPPLV
jgi:hypothetical protein